MTVAGFQGVFHDLLRFLSRYLEDPESELGGMVTPLFNVSSGMTVSFDGMVMVVTLQKAFSEALY